MPTRACGQITWMTLVGLTSKTSRAMLLTLARGYCMALLHDFMNLTLSACP